MSETVINTQSVEDALRKVQDPEIGMDIVTLGLVYKIEPDEGTPEAVRITMTLTTPMCPFGPMILDSVRSEVSKVDGIKRVEIELTFDPPWTPPPEVKMMMGV